MRKYKVSFEPLQQDAVVFLSWATGIDFTATDFENDDWWFCCTVRDDGRVPIVVIVFEFKTPFDAYATVAVADQHGLSRQLLTTLFRTVFERVSRVTVMIQPDNMIALKQAWRMGFRCEGYFRRGYDGIHDASVWGLLPEDCPYLRGRPFTYRVVRQTHPTVTRVQ